MQLLLSEVQGQRPCLGVGNPAWGQVIPTHLSPSRRRRRQKVTHGVSQEIWRTFCQILHPLKGEKLVSALDRNSEDYSSALVSTDDTSGATDNCPVLIQTCRMSSVLICALFYPGRESTSCSTHQEPDHNSGGRVATVSLQRAGVPSDQCQQYSTDVQDRQERPPTGAFLSSRLMNGGGHPERFF